MRLPLEALQDQLSRLTLPVSVRLESTEYGGEEINFPKAFEGEATAVNTGEAIVVELRLDGAAEVPCARCLKQFVLPLHVVAVEQFRRGTPPPGSLPGDLQEDDGELFAYYDGEFIDLTETIRQNALLELPMQPLHAPDCQGLCPTCGHDRNEGPCDCDTKEVDPRLDALRNFSPEKDEV